MIIGWPQGILIALGLIYLFLVAALHGKDKVGKHNFFAALVDCTTMLVLLYFGGFFTGGPPQ